MTPAEHMGVGNDRPGVARSFEWIEEHLAKKKPATPAPAPIEYYITGAEQYRQATKFPPPSKPYTLHLHAGSKLSPSAPVNGADRSYFTFDPHDPTPTIGGNLIMKRALVTTSDTARVEARCSCKAVVDRNREALSEVLASLHDV